MYRMLPFAALLGFLYSGQCGLGQFVEIKAEIEINDWSFWLFRDRTIRQADPASGFSESIFPKSQKIRCVVGTNTWLMEGDLVRNANVTQWFTGTNIIEQTVIRGDDAGATARRSASVGGPGLSRPPVGSRYVFYHDSSDGNPGRTVRVPDLLGLRSRIAWLAFCSGPVLKKSESKIYPPSDFWKETRLGFFRYPFSEKVSVFEDGLGLPKSLTLYATNSQPVVEYQAAQSTNVLGWRFPLEFYLIQYGPQNTNDWVVLMTAKGKVTSIGAGSTPEIPLRPK